jgi:pectate lyase
VYNKHKEVTHTSGDDINKKTPHNNTTTNKMTGIMSILSFSTPDSPAVTLKKPIVLTIAGMDTKRFINIKIKSNRFYNVVFSAKHVYRTGKVWWNNHRRTNGTLHTYTISSNIYTYTTVRLT